MQKILVLATSAAVVGLTPAVGNLTLNAEFNPKKLLRLPLRKSVRSNTTNSVRQEVARPGETALADGDVKTTLIGQPDEQRDEAEKRASIEHSVHDHTSAVSRKPTSYKKASHDAKLKTTPSEGDLKQQCQGTFQTQKNPTVFKQSSRLASVSKGGYVGQPMLKQKEESVADKLRRSIYHVQEATTEPLVCARPMPPLFYPGQLPSEEHFIHRQSRLLAEGTRWAVRQGKLYGTDVYIRWYKLEGRNADALWETICRNTHNRATYGYICEDCLCAVFDHPVDVSVKVGGRELKFHNQILAYFDVNGWKAGSALVLRATDCHGHHRAVKVLQGSDFIGKDIEHEWRVMEALACLPFVPRIYGVIVRGEKGNPDQRHYIISEWLHGHALNYPNDENTHKRSGRILQALLKQIRAMHKLGYAHRDIKPANIMEETEGNVRVIDFGSASPRRVESTNGMTAAYAAPEVWFKKKGDVVDAFAADVYSIAMTWHFIFFGKLYEFAEHLSRDYAYVIRPLDMPGAVPELDEAMADLFYGMAHPDPKERISIDQALKHKYFKMLAALQKEKN